MAQIVEFKEKPLADFYAEVERNLNNPSAMFAVMGALVEEVTEGNVQFIDPTNPTVFLAEMVATTTAAAVNENIANLRLTYPTLSEVPRDLYPHMSDKDYINRFASPASIPVGMMIGLDTMLRDMVRDDSEACRKAIIPRDSFFEAGGITFTLMYPIVIRLYDSGNLEVSYDASLESPFQTLMTNIIPYSVINTTDGTRMIYFQIHILNLKIATTFETIQASMPFTMDVVFDDQFHYARAFHRNSATDGWVEIKTTHTDLVFDRREPTLLLSVEGNRLKVKLPLIYTTQGMRGEIRLQIYTTKGAHVENMTPYSFTSNLVAIDTQRDMTVYTTTSLANTFVQMTSTATMTGGKDALTFEQLRRRVMYNSTGAQLIPITPAQAQAVLENDGFELIRNVDVVTDRLFLANQNLPKPNNPRLITAANIGIDTFMTERSELIDHPFVRINGDRWTLTPRNLFLKENGVIRMLSRQEILDIESMEITARVQLLNSRSYLYTPFHYVFDNVQNEFSLRAYYLDAPSAGMINFVRQNSTLQMPVNTGSRTLTRTSNGYRLTITTLSGNNYKALPDSQVMAQLMFYPAGENVPVYLVGEYLGRSETQERVFAFDINTNYDFDELHRFKVLQVGLEGSFPQDVWSELDKEVHIFHCTNSRTTIYVPDGSNELYGAFQLPDGFVPITHEKLDISYGKSLDNLWTRARSLAVGYPYRTYEFDIPLLYDQPVYRKDPVTGNIFTIVDGEPVFEIEHEAGDPVLDHEGVPIMKYRKGDPVINPSTGQPELINVAEQKKEVDLLFIDGRHYFVNDPVYLAYNLEFVNVLVTWITDDLAAIQDRTLDKTKVFFHPRSQLGRAQIETSEGFTVRIPSEQSPKVDLYVTNLVYSNADIRQALETKTIQVLNNVLSEREINNSEMVNALKEAYGDAVLSVNVYGLGGEQEIKYGRIVNQEERVTLRRVLEIQADQTLIMVEDVEINFFRVLNTD